MGRDNFELLQFDLRHSSTVSLLGGSILLLVGNFFGLGY